MVHIKKIFLKWIFTDKWEFIAPHGKKLENLVTQASQAGISTLNSPLASMCAQSCPTLCDPTDCSPPGSSVHGVFQARILGWVAISSSRGSSQLRDQTHVSCVSCIGRWSLYHWCHRTNALQWIQHPIPLAFDSGSTSPICPTCLAPRN